MIDPQQSLINQHIENQRLIDHPVYNGFGWHIKWTKIDGSVETFAVDGADSVSAAQEKAIKWAARNGWTPPKWWQWWRRRDTS